MSVISINGLPGKGKNVYATYLAKSHFNKTNSFFKRFIRKLLKKPVWINNIYSSYPILLNKRKKIYSRVVTIYDLSINNKFLNDSLIIIDEVQAFYDSDDYKEFPRYISIFNQFHRHLGIKDIYYISQHPGRIVKKLRNVTCEYNKIRTFIVIPIIKLGFLYISKYYEEEDYGKWHHPKKEVKNYDVKNFFVIFLVSKVFKSYNSKYLKVLSENVPYLDHGCFKELSLSFNDIHTIFKSKYF